MVSISFGKSNFSEIQNSYQMTVALVMMFVVLCSISSIIVSVRSSSSQEPVPIKREVEEPEDVAVTPAEIKDPDSEIFSIDSEVTMYEQCNSNSKIIAAAAMNIGQALSSEVTLERNSINNSENEKVRRIEVKNVEILPGSKWTVVSNNNQGVEGETTIVLDLPQSYEGNQLLNTGSECSDNTESYIKDINLIYIPIKLDVKEKNEVEGYRI